MAVAISSGLRCLALSLLLQRRRNPAASIGARATPHLPARGRARAQATPAPRAPALPPSALLPPPSPDGAHLSGPPALEAGAGGSKAEEEGGAAPRTRHRSTMAELGAGGDSHRGSDGAVQGETGDRAAGARGARRARERGCGLGRWARAGCRRSPSRSARPGTAGPGSERAVLPPAQPRPRPRPQRPLDAPPRLSHNRWKHASERGREEEMGKRWLLPSHLPGWI